MKHTAKKQQRNLHIHSKIIIKLITKIKIKITKGNKTISTVKMIKQKMDRTRIKKMNRNLRNSKPLQS